MPAFPYIEGAQWQRVRTHFGIEAFGINAYRADAGTRVIEEHTEIGSNAGGHEELYIVLAGAARFSVADQEVAAGPGTFVHVADPATKRGAVAESDGTIVLVIGAKRGVAFTPSLWELAAPAWDAYNAGNFAEGIPVLHRLAKEHPESGATLYNLACFEALADDARSALDHLERAVALDPKFKQQALEDEDFNGLHGNARFRGITA